MRTDPTYRGQKAEKHFNILLVKGFNFTFENVVSPRPVDRYGKLIKRKKDLKFENETF